MCSYLLNSNNSFGLLSTLYEQFIGTKFNINSTSNINLDCSKDSCMSLLRALANFKLPITNYYSLDYVPVDSEFVRAFAANLSKNQSQFYFNWNSNSKVESSKYIRELRLSADSTADYFGVQNLIFSVEDFKSLVASARHVKTLYIRSSLIPLDCKFDFRDQLDSSNIQYFDLQYSGNADNGDWAVHPERFENLLEAISNSLALRNSLKTLCIGSCGVTKVKAEQMRKKYGLNELQITGV